MAAEIKVKSTLDNTELKSGVNEAGSTLKGFANDKIAGIKGAIAGAFSVGAVVAFGKSIVEMGGQITDMADNLGVGTDSIQALTRAAMINGVGLQDIGNALSKLKQKQDDLVGGNKQAADAFAKLGLSAREVARMGLDELYAAIGNRLANASNETEAFTAVADILGGKVGPKLAATLKEVGTQGLQSVIDKAKEAGGIMDAEVVAKLDEMGDTLDRSGLALKVFFSNVIKGVDDSGSAFGAFTEYLTRTGDVIGAVQNVTRMAEEEQAERAKKNAEKAAELEKQKVERAAKAAQAEADAKKAEAEKVGKEIADVEKQLAESTAKAMDDISRDYEAKQKARIKDLEDSLKKFQDKVNDYSEKHGGVSGRRAIAAIAKEEDAAARDAARKAKAEQQAVETAETKIAKFIRMHPEFADSARAREEAVKNLSRADQRTIELAEERKKLARENANQAANAKIAADAKKEAADAKDAELKKKLADLRGKLPPDGAAGDRLEQERRATSGVKIDLTKTETTLQEMNTKLDALALVGKWTN